jgi:SAM-dependent methyltransferase
MISIDPSAENMTKFELSYICLEPFMPPLGKTVRRRLINIAKSSPTRIEVLDVGGRKSHQTINVPAAITVSDLPRETELQVSLNLGFTDDIVKQTYDRRCNIRSIVFDDMTKSSLPDSSFDCVVATEVLEHVEEDALFVKHVHRVLKDGGIFLMTTPNGDAVKNTNPDHKRHYTKEQLRSLLNNIFCQVEVEYAIRGGLSRKLGLKSWSPKKPLQTVLSMAANILNTIQSASPSLKNQAHGTRHLIATARKGS